MKILHWKNFFFNIIVTLLILGHTTTLNNTQQETRHIRPDAADIVSQLKMIHPYITRPFIPEEVDHLLKEEPRKTIKKHKYNDDDMVTVTYVGKQEHNSQREIENPVIYESVVMNKPTSIIHPVPQRRNSLVSAGINDVVSQFNSQEGVENRNVEVAAAYSIPIKVENTGAIDSSLDGFVTPAFIHKNESQINRKKDDKENIKKVLSANLENDRRTFVANMGNDHIEETLLNAKDRLSRDSNDLKEKVKNNLDELIYAKEIAMKLNNLVVYYETKIKSPKEVNTKNSLAAVNEIDTIIEEIKQKFKI